MKKTGFILALVLIVASLLVVGCNGGDGESTPTPGPGETATPGPGETATPGPGETPAPGEAEPVHFNDLIAFLPSPPSGWTGDDPDGATFTVYDFSWSQGDREYTSMSTDEYVDVSIFDSAYYQGFAWFTAWQMAVEWESNEGYVRKTTIGGYPAYETFDEPDSYGLMVLVAERFLVMVNSETKGSLDLFANMVDYDGIAALR